MEKHEELLARLEENINSDDFYSVQDEIAAELEKLYSPEELLKPIFKLMEKYPLADFGMPGALTHFAEKADGDIYSKYLTESVGRNPTMHTVWLLNRMANGASDSQKEKYITLLRDISFNMDIDDKISSSAAKFVDHQTKEAQKSAGGANTPFGSFDSLTDIFKAFNIISKDKD